MHKTRPVLLKIFVWWALRFKYCTTLGIMHYVQRFVGMSYKGQV